VEVKDLIRPPFANYDIVVYFGGGLFMIPFLNRYLFQPANLVWPQFQISLQSEIVSEIVSGLCLLFTIYIIGHILAYLSSQFIEKLADRLLGKISTAILISSWSRPRLRNEWIRALIFDRTSKIRRDRAVISTIVRVLPHLPALPAYFVIYVAGIFGYYDTRVPYSVIRAARRKLPTIGLGELALNIRTQWYKPLEYYVINRMPVATSRMYNYLVISGLFRTICIILLFSLWAQGYYIIHFWCDGDWFIRPIMGSGGQYSALIEYSLTLICYVFCLFSYLKFQRRYAEEAIFAFVFEESHPPPAAAAP
jgi:hypothetical protein